MIIYTLILQDGRYYVGKTTNLTRRFKQHRDGKGSSWTTKYPPIGITSSYSGDGFDEEKQTLIMMHRFGIENVRGGSYSTIKLSSAQKDIAKNQIKSVMDLCYKCGKGGHVSKLCPTSSTNPLPSDSPIRDPLKNDGYPAIICRGPVDQYGYPLRCAKNNNGFHDYKESTYCLLCGLRDTDLYWSHDTITDDMYVDINDPLGFQ